MNFEKGISMKRIRFLILFFLLIVSAFADGGHDLWLKYNKISNEKLLKNYKKSITGYFVAGNSEILNSVKEELESGLTSMLGKSDSSKNFKNSLVVGKYADIKNDLTVKLDSDIDNLVKEGYLIKSVKIQGKPVILITAQEDIGLLYGTFHFLRLLQTEQSIDDLNISESPKIQLRVLNHWDNLNRTVERGYAGFSIWDWHRLPELKHNYYTEYARANASIGINGTVLNNVNANPIFLTPEYLEKSPDFGSSMTFLPFAASFGTSEDVTTPFA